MQRGARRRPRTDTQSLTFRGLVLRVPSTRRQPVRGRRLQLAAILTLLAAVVSIVALPALAADPLGQVTEFPVTTPAIGPFAITKGPDGNLWFTERSSAGAKIGRVTPTGTVTEFSNGLTPLSDPSGIVAGPDGNLWFTEQFSNKVAKIDPSTGIITEFPDIGGAGSPTGITVGPDGALWFTEDTNAASTAKIGRITTAGGLSHFSLVGVINPSGITTGPDGNLWFTESHLGGQIDQMTTAGVLTQFAVPGHLPSINDPLDIAKGPDGALWFTEPDANLIGRITTTGTITEFPVPTANSTPFGIATGPDGALWFTESVGAGKIGRITTAGTVTNEFPITTGFSRATFITAGPDGNMWFTERDANNVAKIGTAAAAAPPAPPPPASAIVVVPRFTG